MCQSLRSHGIPRHPNAHAWSIGSLGGWASASLRRCVLHISTMFLRPELKGTHSADQQILNPPSPSSNQQMEISAVAKSLCDVMVRHSVILMCTLRKNIQSQLTVNRQSVAPPAFMVIPFLATDDLIDFLVQHQGEHACNENYSLAGIFRAASGGYEYVGPWAKPCGCIGLVRHCQHVSGAQTWRPVSTQQQMLLIEGLIHCGRPLKAGHCGPCEMQQWPEPSKLKRYIVGK